MGSAPGVPAALSWHGAAEMERNHQIISTVTGSGIQHLHFYSFNNQAIWIWKECLYLYVRVFIQMKDSLLNLQKGVGLRDYSSDSEEKRSRYYWQLLSRPPGRAVQCRATYVSLCLQMCTSPQKAKNKGPACTCMTMHTKQKKHLMETRETDLLLPSAVQSGQSPTWPCPERK